MPVALYTYYKSYNYINNWIPLYMYEETTVLAATRLYLCYIGCLLAVESIMLSIHYM